MISIRQTDKADYHAIMDLVKKAFRHERYNRRLSLSEMDNSDFFIPELSLVAEIDNRKIVGHIYLIEISIDYSFSTLGLAHIAVTPEYQGLGIGTLMMAKAHQEAKQFGYGSIISCGGKQFLSRFGYRALSDYGIHYGLFDDHYLAVELYAGGMADVQTKVDFPLKYYKKILTAVAQPKCELIEI